MSLPHSPGSTDPAVWLAAYQPDDYLFACADGVVLGRGPARALVHDSRPLAERAREALRDAAAAGVGSPVLMGAIPFDVGQMAALAIPGQALRAPAFDAQRLPPLVAAPAVAATAVVPVPAPECYEAAVCAALARFAEGGLDKVVLARALDLDLARPLDVGHLVQALLRSHPGGHVFAVPLPHPTTGESVCFVGASPELLVRRRGQRVSVNPLAGSAARVADPARDVAVGEALLASNKDRREHAIVIDEVLHALRPLCRQLDVPAGPSLARTDTLWHLSTAIHGELRDAEISSLDLALAMHPTPAVCGYPTAAARAAIGELEGFERDLFAGAVGWCAADGDGDWAVSIRCARIEMRGVRLYAGAGIVPGSEPARERDETRTKFGTMLRALGLDAAGAR